MRIITLKPSKLVPLVTLISIGLSIVVVSVVQAIAFINFEAESGVLTSSVQIQNEAQASGGSFVRFGGTSVPAGTLLWQADGTLAIDKEWSAWSDDKISSGEPSPDGALYAGWNHPNMQIMSALGGVLPNKPSYRVYMPVGDARQEFKQAHPVRTGFENRVFNEGDETWISWATKLTKHTYAPSWQMFNQFRHVNETGLTTNGSPHGLGSSQGSQNYEWSSDPNIYSGAAWRHDLGIPLAVGKTIKWTFHAKWSSNASTGFMEVFADDGTGWRQVMPKRNQATLLFNSTTSKSGRAAMRFGVYRDPAISNTEAEIYMAGLSVATTRELAEYSAFN
jgi:hypothetical protein